MLLHICDDEKFIDYIINTFISLLPDENIFVIVTNGSELKHVKSKNLNIIVVEKNSLISLKILKELESFDAVILHNLIDYYKREIVFNAPKNVKFHWMCWGADIYNFAPLHRSILGDNEKGILKSKTNLNYKIGKRLELLFPFLNHVISKNKSGSFYYFKKIAKKIDSVSTVLPNEINTIRKYFNKNINYIPFKYGTIESLLNDTQTICSGNNFLIGNSATLSNNHYEALEILYNLNITNYKIYMPLSYGDNEYASIISEHGKQMFGNKFFPVMEFLPITEYNKIFNSCGNVIMNHYRQQGIGNIITAIWKGCRLFLNKKGAAYNYLKSQGVKIFEIEDLNRLVNLESSEKLAAYNRPIIEAIYGKETVLQETKCLINYLKNGK